MLAYLVKRILLMVPTLFGILLITFAVMQFVPGLGEATAGQQQQEVAIGAARCQI